MDPGRRSRGLTFKIQNRTVRDVVLNKGRATAGADCSSYHAGGGETSEPLTPTLGLSVIIGTRLFSGLRASGKVTWLYCLE